MNDYYSCSFINQQTREQERKQTKPTLLYRTGKRYIPYPTRLRVMFFTP